ncbi:MAG: uroporphyrinogen-III C-methyltransferase [Myxococcales bacterium]|nr:uroporphyrinogen-III C-methyltransferase [Myxococcales bacterium]MCB9708633.1 uroporphyrinogen-III C-methyltransferase [Myxococcales bacterium]
MSKDSKVGTVYLVGAGPGDPELITVRGQRRLSEADVVLHDALVHPDLLKCCRPDAEIQYVGKRAGRTEERQAAINARLIAAATSGKSVVRLKGGDPFLFGRGSEEAEALSMAKVPFEVVPGVPSPLAASAYAGISLTHRSLSSSVAYITATESADKDESAHDWAKLATATQTLVIFMGMRKLDTLMELLLAHGRDPLTPAAVIQSASLPTQRTVVGTVGTIAGEARAAGLGMPALTVIGNAVTLRDVMRWYDNKPLFGKRVWVTRMAHQAESLSRLLRDAGADPFECATIRLKPSDEAHLKALDDALLGIDWIVFTSSNGVRCFFEGLNLCNKDARRLCQVKVCAIGPATAHAIETHGIVPDLMPTTYVAEAVLEALLAWHHGDLSNLRFLIPRAALAREVLPEGLRAHGAEVDVRPVYETVRPYEMEVAELSRALLEGTIDVATFTSSSTVTNALEMLGKDAVDLLNRVTVACIGPVTAQTARDLGVRVDVVAKRFTTTGLIEALEAYFIP